MEDIQANRLQFWLNSGHTLGAYFLVVGIYVTVYFSFFMLVKWRGGIHNVFILILWGATILQLYGIKRLDRHRATGVRLCLSPLLLYFVWFIGVYAIYQLPWLIQELGKGDDERLLQLALYTGVIDLIVAFGMGWLIVWFWTLKDPMNEAR